MRQISCLYFDQQFRPTGDLASCLRQPVAPLAHKQRKRGYHFRNLNEKMIFLLILLLNKKKSMKFYQLFILFILFYTIIFLYFFILLYYYLPSKIDELRYFVGHTKASILGITETKLDSTATDQEISINGDSILRNDRNRNGGGVACYVSAFLCFKPSAVVS